MDLKELHDRYPKLKEFESRLCLTLEVEGGKKYFEGEKIRKWELAEYFYKEQRTVALKNFSVVVRPVREGSRFISGGALPVSRKCIEDVIMRYPKEELDFPEAQRLIELAILKCLEKHYSAKGIMMVLFFLNEVGIGEVKVEFKKRKKNNDRAGQAAKTFILHSDNAG